MTLLPARRLLPIAASLLLTACGLLIGIDPELGVKPSEDDSGTSAPDTSVDVAPEAAPPDVAPPPALRWPAEGDYLFQQDPTKAGYDAINGPFISQRADYTTATVSVRWLPGGSCFVMTLGVRPGYKDIMSLCVVDGALVQYTGSREQTFNLPNGNVKTDTKCLPGDFFHALALPPVAERKWVHQCFGNNADGKTGGSGFDAKGDYVWVADEIVPVNGRDVPSRHYRESRTVTGSQTGSNTADWYFSLEDAMLVRWSRDIAVEYPSQIGAIDYTEHEYMTLVAPPDAGADN